MIDFGFSFEIKRDLFEKIPFFKVLEDRITCDLNKKDYGVGVKSITIGVIAVDLEKDHMFRIRKPKYRAGKYKNQLAPIVLEDTLDIDVKISVEKLGLAMTCSDIAKLVQPGFENILPSLNKISIKNFDVAEFCTDLNELLKSY